MHRLITVAAQEGWLGIGEECIVFTKVGLSFVSQKYLVKREEEGIMPFYCPSPVFANMCRTII